ncbi:polysaccharide deacetylase family protein [Paenibacillus sp. P22]|uniref:polysaccharide deacetylase family protein n=1 Tax=Paenibacillus TaxID=44249 RepID=UPI0003902827|nr:polysaccharide deacetylase family protein [Paenibacillus sp. P22]
MKRSKSRLDAFRKMLIARPAAACLVMAAVLLMQAPNSADGSMSSSAVTKAVAAWTAGAESSLSHPDSSSKKRKQRRATVSWAALSSRYPGAFATRGPASPKRAALTFDDVPDNYYTPRVLDILAREHVRATFFLVGQRAAAHPDMVQRIRMEGHAVGSHSYNHTSYARLSLEEFISQIRRTDKILLPQLGFTPRFMRPPYGEIKPEQLGWAQGHGYFVVNWNVDTEDWKGLGAEAIIRNVKRTLVPGSIILQHAGGGTGEDLSGTLDALPRIIAMLRQKGYELVTVPELLGESEAVEEFKLYD